MGTLLVNAISEKVLTPSWGSFLPGVPGPSLHGCFWVYRLWVLFLAACTDPCILPLSSWKPEVGTRGKPDLAPAHGCDSLEGCDP